MGNVGGVRRESPFQESTIHDFDCTRTSLPVVMFARYASRRSVLRFRCESAESRPRLILTSCRNHAAKPAVRTRVAPEGPRWNPIAWYNGHLERNPIRTKCITSGALFAVGDIIAQKVTLYDHPLDVKRVLRAVCYGTLAAPICHFHFNFLEWLVVEKHIVRASLGPYVKMFLDQFGYYSPIMIGVYHFSMGAMEGLAYDDIIKRLKEVYWPSLKACWVVWPFAMVLNFKYVPVPHQINFCLVVSLVWASIISFIRASDSGPGEPTEIAVTTSAAPIPDVRMRQSDS